MSFSRERQQHVISSAWYRLVLFPLPELPAVVSAAVDESFQGNTVRLEWLAAPPEGERTFELMLHPIGGEGDVKYVLLLASDGTRLSRSEREGVLLTQLALAVGRTDNVVFAVEETLRSICQATDWPLGEAWGPQSVEGDEPVLRYYGKWTNERGALETFTTQASGLRFHRGEGMPGAAWVSGKPLWIDDLRTSNQFTRGALAASARVRAAVAIPLMYADADVVAVLQFFMRDVPRNNELLIRCATILPQLRRWPTDSSRWRRNPPCSCRA